MRKFFIRYDFAFRCLASLKPTTPLSPSIILEVIQLQTCSMTRRTFGLLTILHQFFPIELSFVNAKSYYDSFNIFHLLILPNQEL